MKDTTEKKISHLLRRAGFGASQKQIAYYSAKGLAATVTELVNYQQIPNPIDKAQPEPQGDELRPQDVRSWWIERMLYTTRPLEEKMTLYWHNHFATAVSKVRNASYILKQNQLFRTHALGNFRTLLKAVSRDPAMVVWLDNYRNRKGSPNENYGRELMELFTLGIGHYTEKDIKEGARAFTGWFAPPRGDGFRFIPRQHDYGQKTFLGRQGAFDGDDIIDIILEQKQAPIFLAHKLTRFFISDDPSEDLVMQFAQLIREHDYELKPVIERMLRSEAFYAPEHRYAKVKSPAEFVIGSMRMVSGPIPQNAMPLVTRALSYFMRQMGQDLLNPPNVKGWDGGRSWITTSAMLSRANLAAVLLGARPTLGRGERMGGFGAGRGSGLADIDELLEAAATNGRDGGAVVERLALALGAMDVNSGTQAAINSYLTSSGSSPKVALQMLMSSPEFQLS